MRPHGSRRVAFAAFMKGAGERGFLQSIYEQKWQRFACTYHYAQCFVALLATVSGGRDTRDADDWA